MNSRGARGHEKLIQCGSNEQGEDQKKGLQFKNFHKFWLSSQNSCNFSRIQDQKKRSSSQKFHEIRCECTKITKIRAVNINLRVSSLDLHSNSPEPITFFGAQFSLGGAQFSFGGAKAVIWGARPRNAPPLRRACVDGRLRLPTVVMAG